MAIDQFTQKNRTLRATLLGFVGGAALAAGVSVLAIGGVPAMQHMTGQMTQADIAAHIQKASQHLYIDVDATAAQKAALDPIFSQAATDLLPMIQQLHTTHAQVVNLLSAPTVDPAALDQARAAQTAAIDQITQRVIKLVEDSGTILTPDQRKKLVSHLGHHMSMGTSMHG